MLIIRPLFEDDVGGFGPFWSNLTIQLWSYPSATLSPTDIAETMIRVREVGDTVKLNGKLFAFTLSFLTARLKYCGNSSEKLK